MNKSAFDALHNRMFKQKKLLMLHHALSKPASNKSFWILVFDRKESRLEWRTQIKKHNMFSYDFSPGDPRFIEKEGFLNYS